MSAITHRLRRFLPIILGVAVVVFFSMKSSVAHAAGWLDVTGIAYDAMLDLVLGFLVTVVGFLAKLQGAVGEGLKLILSQKIVTNLPIIGITWTVIRDICNLAFLVLFIGIAFATIFNTIKPFKNWHYSSALMPLLIAALLMNLSLAIGKTVVLVSNAATGVLIDLVDKDPGAILVKQLSPNTLIIGQIDLAARAGLNVAPLDARSTYNEAETKEYQDCLNTEVRVIDTNENWFLYSLRSWSNGKLITDYVRRNSIGDCNAQIVAHRSGTTREAIANTGAQIAAASSPTTLPQGTIQEKVGLIADAIFKAVMLLFLISCLGSAAIFLGLRILMVWILLVLSPVAFVSYAIPGKHEGWEKWTKHMIGWNVFGPLYLLTLIPGLAMLGASGEMFTALKLAGGTVDTASMLFQQFFFYAFAAMIFVGGLALSLKSSFALTVGGTQGGIGALATKLGVFQTAESKFGQIAKYTGGQAAYDTLKATAVARGEKLKQVGRNIADRIPGSGLVRPESYEKKLARMRSGAGVLGGAQELTGVVAKDVKAEEGRLQQRLSQMPDITAGDKEARESFLRGQANSSNKNVALAAREMLLRKGSPFMDANERKRTRNMYPNDDAKRAFDNRVKTSAGAAAKEKKKEGEEAQESITAGIGISIANNSALPATQQKTPAVLVDEIMGQFNDPTKPGERDAAIEAFGRKYPEELSSYLASPAGGGMSRRAAIAKAYEPVLKDPASILKLPPEYLDVARNTNQSRSLRIALNDLFPRGAAGTPAANSRMRFQEDLVKKKPSKAREIRLLFS